MTQASLVPATKEHIPFIADSWANSLRAASRQTKRVQPKPFFDYCHRTINAVLSIASTTVAVDSEAPENIMGWSCTNPPNIIHFAYVKPIYRRNGLMKRLVGGMDLSTCTITFWSGPVGWWIIDKYPKITYNPFWWMSANTVSPIGAIA